MIKALQKKLPRVKAFLLLFITILILSCNQRFYNGRILVEQHLWELKQIDTIYLGGKYKPSATWYSKHDRLYYVDNSHEFPYPFAIGTYFHNFDRK
jgi:hypothetical protein